MPYSYPAELADALGSLGLAPTAETPPEVVRAAVNDLYRYELRRARDRLRLRQLDRSDYFDVVVAIRRKYWMLTLPLDAWERICRAGT